MDGTSGQYLWATRCHFSQLLALPDSRLSGIKYPYLRDRLQVALVSDINTDDDHIEGCHFQGMCLAFFHVSMSNVPYLGTSLEVVDRQDTSELDSEGVDVGPVNDVLRQISAYCSCPVLHCA